MGLEEKVVIEEESSQSPEVETEPTSETTPPHYLIYQNSKLDIPYDPEQAFGLKTGEVDMLFLLHPDVLDAIDDEFTPRLDRLIAEEIMGWELVEDEKDQVQRWYCKDKKKSPTLYVVQERVGANGIAWSPVNEMYQVQLAMKVLFKAFAITHCVRPTSISFGINDIELPEAEAGNAPPNEYITIATRAEEYNPTLKLAICALVAVYARKDMLKVEWEDLFTNLPELYEAAETVFIRHCFPLLPPKGAGGVPLNNVEQTVPLESPPLDIPTQETLVPDLEAQLPS